MKKLLFAFLIISVSCGKKEQNVCKCIDVSAHELSKTGMGADYATAKEKCASKQAQYNSNIAYIGTTCQIYFE